MKNKELTKEKLLKLVKEENIDFVKLWFTDILGYLKSFEINVNLLEDALTEGMNFDGSSIEGFARIDESDMVAVPDVSTFMILPWPDEFKVGSMFCDIYKTDGTPYEGCPRYCLKKVLEKASNMGFTFYTGPELEFFYFKDNTNPTPLDHGGYFDLIPRDEAISLRRRTVATLEKMGIDVEMSHHEVAPSQHEIALKYKEALHMADQTMAYKLAVKEMASRAGVYATFMPKPLMGENGSGMHVHQSLFKNGKNSFFDPEKPLNLSDTARSYIAGLLKYAQDITLVTNQWVNSYKRLVPGYEAPINISWATQNRSHLIRIPAFKKDKGAVCRMEYRSPDPACNPYLAFAVMLSAGLRGIEEKLELPEAMEINLFELSEIKRKELGIKTLPGGLFEAIRVAKNSDMMKETLGDHIFENLIKNKEIEWDAYRTMVTGYEIDTYLPIL